MGCLIGKKGGDRSHSKSAKCDQLTMVCNNTGSDCSQGKCHEWLCSRRNPGSRIILNRCMVVVSHSSWSSEVAGADRQMLGVVTSAHYQFAPNSSY